jgi:hypothetical protein
VAPLTCSPPPPLSTPTPAPAPLPSQVTTDLSPTSKFSTILPLTLVLIISLFKEAVEDVKR